MLHARWRHDDGDKYLNRDTEMLNERKTEVARDTGY